MEKNIMKITETKVKTLYTIKLDTADFAILLEQFHDDKENECVALTEYPKAFDFYTTTRENVREEVAAAVMNQMFSRANGDTYNYIARTLGFDGWENAGYYNKIKRIYTMVVYNNGDTLNA
jgi:hypothetical protein